MKPYFDTNPVAGLFLLITAIGWGAMEATHVGNRREEATKAGNAGRAFVVIPFLIGCPVVASLVPRAVPAAAIRPAVVSFVIGMVIMVPGLVLRGWAVKTLGNYFTGTVMVSDDQPVITSGPYRLLRHPSYTGLLMACIGIGLTTANWVGLAIMALLPGVAILWRIHVEERALMTSLGDRYASYAAGHKRLIPLIW